MAIIPFKEPGRFGFLPDPRPDLAPLNCWTYARGVHFEEGIVRKGGGWVEVSDEVNVEPYAVWSISSPTRTYIVYAGLERVYAIHGDQSYDITRDSGPYNTIVGGFWTCTLLNGYAVFNNGVDPPQAWPINHTEKLVDLPNWPANTKARSVRSFKNYLVAVNVRKPVAGHSPKLVKWSHSAPPGTLPVSWDESDATKEAGEVQLLGDDALVDCLPLGNVNVVYGSASMTVMQLAPHPFIFSFRDISRVAGLIALGAACEFPGGHVFVSQDDILMFDGSQIRSIAEGRVRKWFFSNMDGAYADFIRVVPRVSSKEIWIFFPTGGTNLLNMALVWNWAYDTWTTIESPSLIDCSVQMFSQAGEEFPWSQGSGSWDPFQSRWDTYESTLRGLVVGKFIGVSPTQMKILSYDRDTAPGYSAVLERRGLDVVAAEGAVARDSTVRRMVLGVWPSGFSGLKVRAGSQETPTEEPVWGPKVPVSGPKADVYASGRYVSVELSDSASDSGWELTEFSAEIVRLGRL